MSAVLDVVVSVSKDGTVEINKVKRSADQAEKSTKKLTDSTEALSTKYVKMAKNIALTVAGLYAVKKTVDLITGSVVDFTQTSAMFEKYETTLKSITGSSEQARESMAWIQDFTATTPFQLEQVTEGFVKMKAYGLEPMDGTLRTLGDTASAMGKDIVQAVEAMADAVTGENERLKEFGIKASLEGEKVSYAWSDSSGKARNITIDNNKDIIQSTLNAIFNEKYVGAMDEQSKTWDGMMSNIADKWTLFKKDIMDAGLFTYFKAILGVVGDTLTEAFGNAKNGAKEFSNGVIGGIESIIIGVGNMYDMWNGVKFAFASIKVAFFAVVAGIGDGINSIASGWDSMTVSLQNGFKGFVDASGTAFYYLINKLLDGVNTLVNGASKGLGGIFEFIGASNPFGTINLSVGEYVSSIETATVKTKDLINTDWSNSNLKEAVAEADGLLDSMINEDGKNKAISIIDQVKTKVEALTAVEAKNNKEKEDARKHLDAIGAGYGDLSDKAKKASSEEKKLIKQREKADREALQAIEHYNERFTNDFYNAFDSMLHGDLFGSFDSFFGSVSDTLMAPFIEDMSKQMSNTISGLMGGFGSLGQFVGGGILSLAGTLIGGLFGDSEDPAPVLGDMGAKTSDSLANAIDSMLDVQYPMLELTREMTGYLQTISLAFGGVENSLLRSGIDIGGNLFQDTYKKGTLFGGKSTELYGTSVQIQARTISDIMDGHIKATLDTVTKTVKTKWYGSKKTSYSHAYTDISDYVSEYIQKGTTAIFESLTSAGEALGIETTYKETVQTWVKDTEQSASSTFGGIFGSLFKNLSGSKIFGNRNVWGAFSVFGNNVAEETGKWVEKEVTHSLENEVINLGKFDTTGMSSDEIASEIEARFSAQVDMITEKYFGAVTEFQKAGEGLGETLFRVIRNFDQVRHSLDLIDKSVDWRTANIIVDVAGGLDAFNQSFSSFTDNFYSDSEKYQMQLKTMTASFKTLGLDLPENNKEFRALVEGIDTTTDAGATLFAEILSLSDAFAEMTSAGENLRETTNGYVDDISSFMTGQYSFLTAQGKTDYANMMLEQSRGENPVISEVEASRLRLEQAYNSARTQEEFNAISKEHLEVLVNNAEQDATNKDIVTEIKILQDGIAELDATYRRYNV